MSSTYSPSLRLELPGAGDQTGTWGSTTNTNLGTLVEQAITGVRTVSVTGLTTYTLTSFNGTSDEARNAVLVITGALSAPCEIVIPAQNKMYLIKNNTTGSQTISVKPSGGTGVSILNGATQVIYSDSTTCYAGPIIFAGTTGTGSAVFAASPALSGTPTAPTATAGTNTTQLATTAFVGAAVTAVTGSLGTMSTQNANAVAVTGGTVSGTTLNGTAITAGSFVVGNVYTIASVGTTSFTSIGASANTVGITFVATGVGSGTGTAYSYFVGSNSTGTKTISSSTPTGGNDGDIWYQV